MATSNVRQPANSPPSFTGSPLGFVCIRIRCIEFRVRSKKKSCGIAPLASRHNRGHCPSHPHHDRFRPSSTGAAPLNSGATSTEVPWNQDEEGFAYRGTPTDGTHDDQRDKPSAIQAKSKWTAAPDTIRQRRQSINRRPSGRRTTSPRWASECTYSFAYGKANRGQRR